MKGSVTENTSMTSCVQFEEMLPLYIDSPDNRQLVLIVERSSSECKQS